ncbi:MAG: MmgE/PrpD family protein [Deltaproteobacteria bacterium]|nr:MmgE/PrpD family protein [Deltaproteobacteria bacterium]MBW2306647.1 MmgE/PrpD family protein [Deltaproteobacteria bacterium]
MDIVVELARNVLETNFERLSLTTVETTKKFILDTLGVGMAGSSAEGAAQVIDQVKEWGGREESTILVRGGRVPAPMAALANSVMFHARDFDDTHDGAVVHANAPILPAALAAVEKIGGCTGREFLSSMCTGIDLACRLGLAVGKAQERAGSEIKWMRTAVCGAFGAAAASGRIMGLDVESLVNAMGILLSTTAGTRQVVIDSALTKRMQPGFMAQAALQAVHLARRGVTGCREVFEGPYGFFRLYWDGQYRREELTEGLGKHFEVDGLSFKPYPCCRYTHGAIDATLRCVKRNGLKPGDVKRVDVHLVKHHFFDVVSRPFEIRGNPTVDAQFSTPYTVAAAILDGRVFLDSFEPERVQQPRYAEMAQRVFVHIDQDIVDPASMGPVTVEFTTCGGQRHSETVNEFKGHPRNPLSVEECREKFVQCAEYSVHPFPATRLEEISHKVMALDSLQDAGEVARLMAP